MAPCFILLACFYLAVFNPAAGEKEAEFNIQLCSKTVAVNKIGGIQIHPNLVYVAQGEEIPSLKLNITTATQDFACNHTKTRTGGIDMSDDMADDALSELFFTTRGYIGFLHAGDETRTEWFHHSEVCVDRSPSTLHMRTCEDKRIDPETGTISYATPVWISKCCPPGYVQDRRSRGKFLCQPSPLSGFGWLPRFYDQRTFNMGRCVSESKENAFYRYFTTKDAFDGYGLKLIAHPSQGAWEDATMHAGARWRLLGNGSLAAAIPPENHLNLHSTWEIYDDGFCVDGIIKFHPDKKFENTMSRIAKFKMDPTFIKHKTVGNHSFSTKNGTDPIKPGVQSFTFAAIYYVSLCPLIFTVVAYCLTWESHNVHGWTILTHILALIGSNFFTGTSVILGWDYSNFEELPCAIVGGFAHFFYLLSYMWLTMINFDLWWTFRIVTAHTIRPKHGLIRYLIYTCVATFIPVTIIAIAGGLNGVYGKFRTFDDSEEDSDCEIIAPNYGSVNCHVSNQGQGVYMYYPLAVLFLVNMGFYLATVLNIFPRRWASLEGLKSADHRRLALLFLKLFAVSGVGLGFDFIGWISEPNATSPEDMSLPFFVIFVFNILGRALALFFIFAWKEKTKEIVVKAIWRKSNKSAHITDTPDHSGAYTGETLDMD